MRKVASWLLVLLLPAGAWAQSDGFPPFAFPAAPISFSNGDVTLSGVLLKPEGPGPFPAMVLLHGAGASTHDEPAYRLHANAFVRAGFTVLSYDKRGSGKSGGDLSRSDFEDLAADALAAAAFLAARTDIDKNAIGFLGRSEGGWVACLAASREPSIAFVVMSSGAAVRPIDQVRFWTRAQLNGKGASALEVERAMAAREAQWDFYRRVARDPSWGTTAAAQSSRAAIEAQLPTLAKLGPGFAGQRVADPATNSSAFYSAFMRKLDFDPLPALTLMRAPLLEILGAKEDVVEVSSTMAALGSLQAVGRDVTIKVLPDVGHPLLIDTPLGPRYPADYPELAARWAAEKVRATMPRTTYGLAPFEFSASE